MTLPRSFIRDWESCKRCPLSDLARLRVIGIGSLPADVVFIGEAPGEKEDILGRPFVGKAGSLMKKMIMSVIDPALTLEELNIPRSWQDVCNHAKRGSVIGDCPEPPPYFTMYISNTVACAPWTDETRQTWREPNKAEAAACSPRLEKIIELAKPKTIIYVGQVAKRFHKTKIPTLTITHPSSILRMNIPPEMSVPYHKTIINLREHIQGILNHAN